MPVMRVWVTGIVIAAAAPLGIPAALAGSLGKPAIQPVATAPLQARGVRFKPHERVQVRVVSDTITATRRIVVGPSGNFTVTFPGISVDRCLGYSLSAAGSFGDRAAWAMKLPPLGCAPG